MAKTRKAKPDAKQRGTLTHTFRYLKVDGTLNFEVLRYTNPKRFAQRQPGRDDEWVWNTDGVIKTVYHLPEVIAGVEAQSVIYILEGERKTDAACALGVIATCSPEGAGGWKDDYAEPFLGADVVILPDNDEPGIAHADCVAASLNGIAARIRILTLPGLDEGEDFEQWLERGGTAEEFAALTETAPDAEPPPPWTRELQKGKNGGALNNFANVMVALRGAPEMAGCFSYNEMARIPIVMKPLPGQSEQGHRLREHDVLLALEWLQRHGFMAQVGRPTTHDAVVTVARDNSFHPLLDHLEGLVWDGTPRLTTWLQTYLGAQVTEEVPAEYLQSVGRMFLIQMIARVYKPGCRADYTLTLEGSQGVQKSTVCEILAGGEWFGDSLPDLRKLHEIGMYLRDKWLVELSELASIQKHDLETMKGYLTRRVENYRPSYGRELVSEPRQCVHIGTTNNRQYMRDETGSRRLWGVLVGEIKLDELKQARDQLMAEAIVAYKAGEKWWPAREFEEQVIKPQQDARYENDVWFDNIFNALSVWGTTERTIPGTLLSDITIVNIAFVALGFENSTRLGTLDQRRISAVLRRLGWEEKKTKIGRVWSPGPRASVRPPEMAKPKEAKKGTKPGADDVVVPLKRKPKF